MNQSPQKVTIVPPHALQGQACKTHGTKVVLEDGTVLGGVTRIELTACVNDVWRARIEVTPTIGVMAGMEAEIIIGKPSWWRRLLCRIAGVQLRATNLDSAAFQHRLP